MARYEVKRGKEGDARAAVLAFVEEVRQKEPGTAVYEAFQEGDTRWFVHLMAFRDEAAEEAHRNSDHCRRFVSELSPLCEREPSFTELAPIHTNRSQPLVPMRPEYRFRKEKSSSFEV